ncbi:MAG: hypothetical protein IBX70_13135 [Clostridia bacterium]|nr:hypothetical protein [Clostridia bacterium]
MDLFTLSFLVVAGILDVYSFVKNRGKTIASERLHLYHDKIIHVVKKCPSLVIIYEH